jgi:hypothetical protein
MAAGEIPIKTEICGDIPPIFLVVKICHSLYH